MIWCMCIVCGREETLIRFGRGRKFCCMSTSQFSVFVSDLRCDVRISRGGEILRLFIGVGGCVDARLWMSDGDCLSDTSPRPVLVVDNHVAIARRVEVG